MITSDVVWIQQVYLQIGALWAATVSLRAPLW